MRTWIEEHQVLTVALAASLGFLLWQLRAVFIVLFVGYILAAALRPVVDLADRLLPRALAILAVYLALLVALFGVIVPTALSMIGEAHDLHLKLTGYLEHLQAAGGFLSSMGLNGQSVLLYLQEHAITFTTSTASAITSAVTAIIISIYLLYDWHELHRSLTRSHNQIAAALAGGLQESERMLGSWVRGQLLLSISVGILVCLALWIIGLEPAPLLGVLAGFTELIPYIGPFLGAAPAILLALNTSTTQALIVAGVYLVIQQLENHLLVPLIMKHSVRLHPTVIIAVMLAGFEVLGLIGVILAVPFTALVRIAAARLWYA